ncbi:hypothetical protein L6Q96_17510 [Candidatus Binatia bacterium]|nr:hypothetical protein [Candidatus Binatia bacterium]
MAARLGGLGAVAFVSLAILLDTPARALFTNGGFESTFAGWTKTTSKHGTLPGPCNGPFSAVPPTPGGVDRTVIVSASPPETGVDPNLGAGATLKFPKFGLNSARVNGENAVGLTLNLNSIGQQSTITALDIDPVDSLVHIRFVYAPVIVDPGHPPCDQPFFRIRLTEVLSGTLLYEKFVFANEPGVPWKWIPAAGGDVGYTDWTVVDVPAPSLAIGSIVELDVSAGDCAGGGPHWAYVYVDGFGAQLPGLSVVKTASEEWVEAGANLTYTFTYRNDGTEPVANVIVNETIPDCATWVSQSAPSTGGTCGYAAGVVTCNLGTLAPGAYGTFTVTVTASTDTSACFAIHNGNYTIEGTGVNPTLGPAVITPILGACVTPPVTMAAWWPFDEPTGNTANETIADHDGTHQGTLPIARLSGHVGQSLDLDGAGQFVLVPHPSDGALDFGPETGSDSLDFSIDAWIRPDPDSGYRAILWKGIKHGFGFGLRDDRLSLLMRSSGGAREAVSGSIPSLTDGQWHLVAVTVDRDGGTGGGGLVRFYVDGTLAHTESLSPLAGNLTNTMPAGIGFAYMEGGGFVEFNSQSFDGGIDELEVFQYVLDPTSVLGIWLADADGKCQRWCAVPRTRGLCASDTSATVPLEIHNPSPVGQTYSITAVGLQVGFQLGSQTSTVLGPSSVSLPPETVNPASIKTVSLTLQRPSGLTAQGERAAYRVTISAPDGDRQCVGFLVDERDDCFVPVDNSHGRVSVGVPIRKPVVVYNTSGSPKSYDLTWSVEDSTGASDMSVVSLGSNPPGTRLTRNVTVPAGSTLVDEITITPLVHDGTRTFDVILSADLDGDGEPEPVASTGLRTKPPRPELMPGRVLTIAPGKLAFVARAPSGRTFELAGAGDDPRTEGGTLEIVDTGGTGSTIYALPASGWTGLGRPAGAKGYRYKGTGTPSDPCRTVLVKNKVVKAVCKGLGVSVAAPFTGEAGIVLSLGSDTKRYCTTYGGTTVRNDTSGLKRKEAPARDRCAAPNP